MFGPQDHMFALCAYKESPYLEECLCSLLEQAERSQIVVSTSTPNAHIADVAHRHGVRLVEHEGPSGIARDWLRALSCCETPLDAALDCRLSLDHARLHERGKAAAHLLLRLRRAAWHRGAGREPSSCREAPHAPPARPALHAQKQVHAPPRALAGLAHLLPSGYLLSAQSAAAGVVGHHEVRFGLAGMGAFFQTQRLVCIQR